MGYLKFSQVSQEAGLFVAYAYGSLEGQGFPVSKTFSLEFPASLQWVVKWTKVALRKLLNQGGP